MRCVFCRKRDRHEPKCPTLNLDNCKLYWEGFFQTLNFAPLIKSTSPYYFIGWCDGMRERVHREQSLPKKN